MSEPAYVRPLPGNIILVNFDKRFARAVKDAHYEGVSMAELAAHCGMLESVLRIILLRELGLKRGQKLRRPPPKT